jgi:hypothetical protein
MKDVVEFVLKPGITIPVEVEDSGLDFTKVSREGGTREASDKAPRSFNEALERVRPMADLLIERLRELAAQPDEVEIEFGIKLSGEVGALIASTSTEANFRIKLAWTRGK